MIYVALERINSDNKIENEMNDRILSERNVHMIEIKKLSNGMTVVLEPMDYLKTVAFGVWVKVGSRNETKENNGIAHVIEHMLFKGTKKRTSRQIADDMALIGGNVNAYTTKECTSFYTTTLAGHLPAAIEIISDMLNHSVFDAEALAKEKGVIIEEIDMYDDSPEDLVHEMLQQEIWKDHPLGYIISGTKENVMSMTKEQIEKFMAEHYVAENMIISLAGKFDTEQVMELLEEAFGSVPNKSKETTLEAPVYHQVLYNKEKDVEQVHLNIAFDSIPYDHEDKYVLSILNSILGGGINSRLFMEIREELGLTYSIYSYGSSHYQAGLFHIYAAMNPSQTEIVFDSIFDVIDEIAEKGIAEDEMIMTVEQIKTDLVLASESAKARMSSNAKSVMSRGYIIPVEEILKKLNEVTSDDVVRFVKQYFVKEKASISLVGNLEGIDIEHFKKKVSM